MLASSDGISSCTSLKPQHCNFNPNPLANQLWCSDFLTPPTPLFIPHRLPALSLIQLKNWCSIHSRWSISSLKYSVRFRGIFPSLKQNFNAYRSSNVSSSPDYIFEIHQLWQSSFSRVYSNSCCSCSFERYKSKILLIGWIHSQFDIVAGVLQRDTVVPYLFIISLDYVLRTRIDLMKENSSC